MNQSVKCTSSDTEVHYTKDGFSLSNSLCLQSQYFSDLVFPVEKLSAFLSLRLPHHTIPQTCYRYDCCFIFHPQRPSFGGAGPRSCSSAAADIFLDVFDSSISLWIKQWLESVWKSKRDPSLWQLEWWNMTSNKKKCWNNKKRFVFCRLTFSSLNI